MNTTTIYRCTVCRHTSERVNWSDATHLDWEGNVINVHVPVCMCCGGNCRQLSTLSTALADVARSAA